MSLESKDRQEVPLAEELAFLDHYLAIQKIRFGDHLRVVHRCAPEVNYASVPSMFIQPLVENAIRHGISRRASGGTASVRASRWASRLEIRVMDDGRGIATGLDAGEFGGIGFVDYAATHCGAASQWGRAVLRSQSRRRRDGSRDFVAVAARWRGRQWTRVRLNQFTSWWRMMSCRRGSGSSTCWRRTRRWRQ